MSAMIASSGPVPRPSTQTAIASPAASTEVSHTVVTGTADSPGTPVAQQQSAQAAIAPAPPGARPSTQTAIASPAASTEVSHTVVTGTADSPGTPGDGPVEWRR